MKILIHSNAPWVPTGYGQQTALMAPQLAELGHEVAISAYHGLQGAVTTWGGLVVYPRYTDQFGNDVIAGHARHFGADLVLSLCDVWVLDPAVFALLPTASWTPVDCEPLSVADSEWFSRSGATPIAMSRHGRRMFADAGMDACYVPHAVDTQVFRPMDQAQARRELNLPADAFIVGINAANKGSSPPRKAFAQQIEAFARLRKRHGDAILLLHTDLIPTGDGVDIPALIKRCGLPEDAVVFCDQYGYRAGLFSPQHMATWYNACDVVSNATYGEGFGLATLEAQACGVPVVITDNSASRELLGSGWKVPGRRHWQNIHRAWWSEPDVDQLARVFTKAYGGDAAKRRGDRAREFALAYDAQQVAVEYFKPTLDALS